jgi:hypothetical protein
MGKRTCIFCDAPANSREHIFPDWILKLHGSDRPFRQKLGRGETRTFTGDLTVRGVCNTCNLGWMSTLETAVSPFTTQMTFGETINLTELQQTQLSVWAAKMAMVLGGTRPANAERFYTSQNGKTLASGVSLPPLTRVWLGKLSASGIDSTSSYLFFDGDVVSERPDGCVNTITVGSLVFQVVTFRHEDEANRLEMRVDCKNGDWDNLLVSIWPPAVHPVIWPPNRILSLDQSEGFLWSVKDRWRIGTENMARLTRQNPLGL